MKSIIFILLLYLSPAISHAIFYQSPSMVPIENVKNKTIKKNSKALALKIKKRFLEDFQLDNKAYYRVRFENIKDMNWGPSREVHEPLCDGEKFQQEPSVGGCTGFLIKEDAIATAGHCHYVTECHLYSWVFNYNQQTLKDNEFLYFPKEDIYNCKTPIFHDLDFRNLSDIAIFQLDRKVKNPTILELDLNYTPLPADPVYTLSYPLGMPLKASLNGEVNFQETNTYMRVMVDMFPGSSGAPLFNLDTGKVIAVLVRGEEDFIKHETLSCYKHVTCQNGEGCQGGDFSSLNVLKDIAVYSNSELLFLDY